MRLTRRTPLVAHGYAHQLGTVAQLTDDVLARGVHDRVGDQLGHDQSRRVAGVLAHRPAVQPSPGQASGMRGRTRMRGQFEAEPALGSGAPLGADSRGGAEAVGGSGVCS
jgi:hypothetical protein